MADPRGFLKHDREVAERRPVHERVGDWREVYQGDVGRQLLPIITTQAGRCMDCGIPFCHQGCPLGNLVPEWNDLAFRGDEERALAVLLSTNNFPEVTGRVCPAPCEASCVLGIENAAVNIKAIEKTLSHRATFEPAHVAPATGRRVAVVGSGPAGLAVAQQLTRAGHAVTVLERDDRIGGLLRYGIPDFKLQKEIVD